MYARAFHEMRTRVGDFPDSVIEQPNDYMRKHWASTKMERFVYVQGSEIIGYAHIVGNEIGSISVKSQFQGQGIGRKFIKFICNKILEEGYNTVSLYCVVGNWAKLLYDSFTPSRKVTHWMNEERKVASDCDSFCNEYIFNRKNEIQSQEQYSFLLGYYVHLITDAAFQWYIRDDKRVKDTWMRINANENLRLSAMGYPNDWDSVKKLISKNERMHEIHSMEAEYLRANPTSGYLTEILLLKEFPDYIDYLPHGGIVRKIGVMGYLPELDENLSNPISMSREEFISFVDNTAALVVSKLREMKLI